MTFFNSVLNLSVFLVGFALLVLSLYLKYNDTFACVLKTDKVPIKIKSKWLRSV